MTNGIFQSKRTRRHTKRRGTEERKREKGWKRERREEEKERKSITAAVKRGEIFQQLTFKVERLYTKYEL